MTKRSRFGWTDFLLGLAMVVLGIWLFANPQTALGGIIVLFSVLVILNGIIDIMFYVRLKSNTGLGPAVSLVAGIISVLAGFMLLLNPVLGQWIFAVVFPIWVLARGISRLANHRHICLLAGKAASIISAVINIAGIVLGVLMLFNPMLSSLSLGYLVAVSLVLHGVGNIVESFSKLGEKEDAEQEELSWQ